MRCKTFSDWTRGSDPRRVWNTAECKCALEALLAGVSTKRTTKQHRHLNRSKTRKIHCNTLRNFPLQGFNKHGPWFRCGRKGEHLNLTARQNPAANPLATNALQDLQQLHPWFRSLAGLECRGMQMCLGGTSGRGIHQTCNRVPQASEPERNTKNNRNTLRNFLLRGFTKHLLWSRCSGKGEHLNRDKTQKIHRNSFRNFPLRGFNKHLPWFRCRAEEKSKNHFSSRYNTLDICASFTCHFSLSSYAIFILSLSDNST